MLLLLEKELIRWKEGEHVGKDQAKDIKVIVDNVTMYSNGEPYNVDIIGWIEDKVESYTNRV